MNKEELRSRVRIELVDQAEYDRVLRDIIKPMSIKDFKAGHDKIQQMTYPYKLRSGHVATMGTVAYIDDEVVAINGHCLRKMAKAYELNGRPQYCKHTYRGLGLGSLMLQVEEAAWREINETIIKQEKIINREINTGLATDMLHRNGYVTSNEGKVNKNGERYLVRNYKNIMNNIQDLTEFWAKFGEVNVNIPATTIKEVEQAMK